MNPLLFLVVAGEQPEGYGRCKTSTSFPLPTSIWVGALSNNAKNIYSLWWLFIINV